MPWDRFEIFAFGDCRFGERGVTNDLADRLKSFRFRDIRPKAAGEIGRLNDASKLLGHTDQRITKNVYWISSDQRSEAGVTEIVSATHKVQALNRKAGT